MVLHDSQNHTHKKNHIHLAHPTYLLFSPVPLHPLSAKSPTQILHSTHKPRGDARRQCQPDLRGSGLTNALRQVDEGPGGADQGRQYANGTQCDGGHQHP